MQLRAEHRPLGTFKEQELVKGPGLGGYSGWARKGREA